MRLAALVVALVTFTAWSLVIVAPEGLPGLFAVLSERPWARQVFVDLCLALTVAWAFVGPEARRLGLPLWPYLLATPFVGSIALLAFLVHREWRRSRRTPSRALPGDEEPGA
ncbi:MAG: DUF2834 domain-containing protein [Myxococcaceae bacterium]|jgi:hypothetical protein|nr:DUF2834 domain-containing protein [Myxococcaceae bacterium]